jgi:membrane protein YqaA with SNARE-associated domain
VGIVRVLLGFACLLVVVVLAVRALGPQLQATGRIFVDHFGLAGMALGAFLADGFHFPVPPQFYMLLSIAAGHAGVSTLAAVSVGSLCGGSCAYAIARRLARFPRLARWLARAGERVLAQFHGRNAYRSAVLISFTPIAFSMVCYVSGLYRLGIRPFLVVLFLRIPKLVLYYQLVKLGWHGL